MNKARRALVTATALAMIWSVPVAAQSTPVAARSATIATRAGSCPVTLFKSGTGGYDTYRIPSVVRTYGSNVLAFAEGRVNSSSDTGDIDTVMRLSTDGGCTWGPIRRIADFGTDAIGNPTPVYDAATRRVVLLGTRTGGTATSADIRAGRVSDDATRRVFLWSLTYNGAIRRGPEEITTSVKRTVWRWYATGPGHGIQLVHGKHAGRLVVAAAHSRAPLVPGDDGTENRYYENHLIYSDDHGATWRVGAVDTTYDGAINTNETAIAELPDGTVYLNARDQRGTARGNRAVAHSKDGGRTLAVPFRTQPIKAPIVFCSTLSLGSELIFVGPEGTGTVSSRSNLTLRVATRWQSGEFTVKRHLWSGPAAYSDLTALALGKVGVLYERGYHGPYEQIAWTVVPRSAR